MYRTTIILASLLTATGVAAQTPAAPTMTGDHDWSTVAKADAQAIHDAILDSHPGVHDSLNPEFSQRLEDGLRAAQGRAATVTTPAGWWWTLRAYVASFDEGHLQLGMTDQSYALPMKWPGFTTGYTGDAQVVDVRDPADKALPPVGARLVGCDGITAGDLAAQRVGTYRGRWFLESQHIAYGAQVFLNLSNLFLNDLKTCQFESAGATKSYDLTWRAIDSASLDGWRPKTAANRYTAGLSRVGGGWWISMPDFDGSPSSDTHRDLMRIVNVLNSDPAAFREAKTVVLDLRGNGGGSSHYSTLIAKALWGDDWTGRHGPPPIEGIDWRASAANQAMIESYVAEWTAAKNDPELIGWMQSVADGMKAARDKGESYYREADDEAPESTPASAAVNLMHGRVYVLTDSGCASACLDAVDLWKALGAEQVGRQTSADTVYMEIRPQDLPSGLAKMWLPMKVWRGRARGNNEPQTPDYVFDGDIADTAALKTWIGKLN